MYVTARSRDAEGTVGLVQSMPITGAGHSLLPASQPMEVQTQAVGMASNAGEGPNSNWGGTAYLMPVVTVPYANTMGQVNLHWPPSQDVYGKDLPLSADVNTLRYFFNLGIEYYGMSSNIQQQQQQHHHQHQHHHHHQQQQQQQQHYSYVTSTPQTPHVQQNGPLQPTILVPYDPKTSTAITEIPLHQTHSTAPRTRSSPEKPSPSPLDFKKSQVLSTSSTSSSQEKEVKDSMDSMASDLSDSGFTSSGEGEGEGEGEQGAEDDVDAPAQPEARPLEEEAASSRGGEEVKVVKGKGKRKYYMYGNHKLIKPIKDIPPRFLQLLTHMKAAKERCQGQPIYMLASPAEDRALEQDSRASLNAEAQCFYPRHQYNVCVATAGNPEVLSVNSSEASTSHLPPHSLPSYAPQLPPPATLASSGSLGSVHVQSSPSLGSSLPPPPLPPAHVRAPSVDTDSAMSLVSGKIPVKSLPNAETEYRSAKCAPSPSQQTENASGLSLVPVGVSPSQAVSNMSSGVPNVPPPHFLPASACSSLSTAADNQPRVKYYVYPSSPLSTLQGAGNPPSMPPGQVTYVMNPVTYGPPPSGVSYPPPVVGFPAYSRAVPCPTVAVQ